jgi:hypothetical protein
MYEVSPLGMGHIHTGPLPFALDTVSLPVVVLTVTWSHEVDMQQHPRDVRVFE